MASRRLDDLSPWFKPLAIELIARCVEAGICVLIVNTRRTDAEQAEAVRTGHSWVTHSRHQDGDAIDLVPFALYQLHGLDKLAWSADEPAWLHMGVIGEGLGLRWGGRWTQKDMGHFEFTEPSPLAPRLVRKDGSLRGGTT